MKPYRFLVEENPHTVPAPWKVYRVTGNDARGKFVATVWDHETLRLLIDAPAKAQLLANVKKLHPEIALKTRHYSGRTLRDYAHAFVNYLRRLS